MYFEILQQGPSKYWWRICANNHEKLAHSEILNSKAACYNAIRVVQGHADGAKVYDLTDD